MTLPAPLEPPPKWDGLRKLARLGFFILVAVVLGGYGVVVAVRLIAKLY